MKIVQTILFVFLFLEFRAQNNMALLFAETEAAQADQQQERRGPALAAAYDSDGQPTKNL